MDLMGAIKSRRSIRKCKTDSVPEDALQKVMEAVIWAPSSLGRILNAGKSSSIVYLEGLRTKEFLPQ
jgi:nitroreductase